MKRLPLVLLIVVSLVGVVALIWPRTEHPSATARPLICYVGGTMTPVFNALAAAYEKATGRRLEITSADSGELLATIEMQLQGDLYVAHDPFMDIAMRRGLGVNAWCIAEVYPVMIVQKRNPKRIKTLRDFLRPDVRVYLTDYEHSTLGYLLPIVFKNAGVDFDELNRSKRIPTHRSGSWVANQVIMDAADAALVWQAVAHLREKDLDVIPLDERILPVPGVDAITSATGKRYFAAPVKVAIVSLACSQRQSEAEEFVKFVSSEAGKAILKDNGFKVSDIAGRREYANGVRVEGR